MPPAQYQELLQLRSALTIKTKDTPSYDDTCVANAFDLRKQANDRVAAALKGLALADHNKCADVVAEFRSVRFGTRERSMNDTLENDDSCETALFLFKRVLEPALDYDSVEKTDANKRAVRAHIQMFVESRGKETLNCDDQLAKSDEIHSILKDPTQTTAEYHIMPGTSCLQSNT